MIERYTPREMAELWSDENKFRTWLKVELEAANAMARLKIIPKEANDVLQQKADFKLERINEIEAEVNHDVIAFLTSVEEIVGDEAKYLHYGMTSSDVLDTSWSVLMQQAAGLIDKKLQEALTEIRKLAKKYKDTPCIGRTHGVLAEPMTLGLKFAVWYTELKRGRERFGAATEMAAVGKISGAVGNFANLDPRVEQAVCRALKLRPAGVSTQVLQRDRHAYYVTTLALLASSLEKFGTEVRNLQRTEIGEMAEGFAKKQKGSSAMPHKKNPITAERLAGIARLARGYAVTAMENITLWHERDIAHSSAERVIIPDITTIVYYGLLKFIEILKGLVINEKRMLENIYYGGGLVFSQRLLLALAPKVGSRDKAYRLVQRNAMKAAAGSGRFRDLVKKDKEITEHMSEAEIDKSFELEYYTRHVDTIFRRVFGR
jgi:adenylosuccinate lyase